MMSENAAVCFEKFQQNANFATALELQFPDRADWSCVLRFYAALQLMNAYLIDKKNVNLDPMSVVHDDRRQAMKQCPELREAPRRFRELKDLSERVRYDAAFTFTDAHRKLAFDHLTKLVAIVEPKLKRT